jgi:hypothetical protein
VTRRSDDKERAASHLITGGNASKTSSLSLLRHRDHTKKGRFLIMKSLVSLEQCREAALSVIARTMKALEPVVEALPFVNRLGCAVTVIVARRRT